MQSFIIIEGFGQISLDNQAESDSEISKSGYKIQKRICIPDSLHFTVLHYYDVGLLDEVTLSMYVLCSPSHTASKPAETKLAFCLSKKFVRGSRMEK